MDGRELKLQRYAKYLFKQEMTKRRGFTLMELMVVITVISLLSVTAVGLFYQTLRGGSRAAYLKELDQNAALVINVLEGHIRNAREVSAVGASSCPGTASTLSIIGLDGRVTQFSLTNGKVASNGGEISSSTITISNLSFTCLRNEGIPDQVTISFLAQYIINSTVVDQKTYTSTVGLRNF